VGAQKPHALSAMLDGMTQQVPGPPNTAGERWNVNLPAVIGVVFVLLIGVIAWVVTSSGDDGDSQAGAPTPSVPVVVDDVGATSQPSAPVTTTPAPMPEPSITTAPPTSDAASTVTTAPGSEPGAVPGDLAVAGRPMQRPGCDDSFITVIASAVGASATAAGIAQLLEAYPASNYLRTDQTCPSLTPDIDGEPIYVVYLGPFAIASDACVARAQGPDGAYARRLSTEVGPDHGVDCS
jgi:hypothetical protein